MDFLMPLLWLLGAILLLWERLAKLRNDKKSTDGDVAEKVSEAWQRLNQPLQDQIESLRKESQQDRRILREYMRGTRILTLQLEERRIIPNWFPPAEYLGVGDDIPTQPLIEKPAKSNKRGGFGDWKR